MTTHHDLLFLRSSWKDRTPSSSVTALFSVEKNSPYPPYPPKYSIQVCTQFNKPANTSNFTHLQKYWKRKIKDNI